MPLMFSISGLRGIASMDLTPEIVFGYMHAFGQFQKARKVVVGCDTRPSSPNLFGVVARALNYIGCDAISLGVAPTPTVLFMVRQMKAHGGVVITASHNPIEYNGFKFVSKKGEFFNHKEFERFKAFISKNIKLKPGKRSGRLYMRLPRGILHVNQILKTLKLRRIHLRIGVDAVNGAGSELLPELLEKAGCQVYKIHCQFKPSFPRSPEPTPGNIGGLCRLVKENNLDIGFAVDPDCDRLAIVDEKGTAIGEENTLVLAADYLLNKKRGIVVTNLSTTALMDFITKKYRCRLFRTRVGEAYVVEKLKKMRGILGGEGNGGVIFPKINATRDALVAAALILKLVSERGQTISKIVNSYPKYFMMKKKLALSPEQYEKNRGKMIRAFKGKVNLADGLRITTRDFWLHVRPSNTEPLVRIICEGTSKARVLQCIKKAEKLLLSR